MNYNLRKFDPETKQFDLVDTGDFMRIAEAWLIDDKNGDDDHLIIDDGRIGEEVYLEDLSVQQFDALLPRRAKTWHICDRCRGDGTCLISGLEGVAFTADEFEEAFDLDERERYFNGGYDRSCPDCDGSGKVLLVDDDVLEHQAPHVARWRRDWIECERELDAAYEAERRMGA